MARLVLVGVYAPEPVFVCLEVKGKGREWARRAKPNEAVGTEVDIRLEVFGEELARGTVHAVGGDHEVGVSELTRVGYFSAEANLGADFQGARGQDL